MDSSVMKVAVIGSPGVGKLSTLRAFAGKKLQEQSHNDNLDSEDVQVVEVELKGMNSSDTSDKQQQVIDSKINVQFWCCRKEPASVKSRQRLFSGAICVMIMYDVTSYKTYVQATTRFFEEAKSMAPEAFIILIGTKSDLAAERVVDISEVEVYSSRNNLFFMEVSAMSMANIDLVLKVLRIRAKHTISAAKYAIGGANPVNHTLKSNQETRNLDNSPISTEAAEASRHESNGYTIRSILEKQSRPTVLSTSNSFQTKSDVGQRTRLTSFESAANATEEIHDKSKHGATKLDSNGTHHSPDNDVNSSPFAPSTQVEEWAQFETKPEMDQTRTRLDSRDVIHVRPPGSARSRMSRARRSSTQELSMEYESLKKLFESTFEDDRGLSSNERPSAEPGNSSVFGEETKFLRESREGTISLPGSAGPTVVRVSRTGSIEIESTDGNATPPSVRKLHLSHAPQQQSRLTESTSEPNKNWNGDKQRQTAELRRKPRHHEKQQHRSRAESNTSVRTARSRQQQHRSRAESNTSVRTARSRQQQHRSRAESNTSVRTTRSRRNSQRSRLGSRASRANSNVEESSSTQPRRRSIRADEMTLHEKTTVAAAMKRRDSMRSVIENGGLSNKDVGEVAHGLDHTRTNPKMRQTAFSKWETSAPPLGEYHSTHKIGAKSSAVAPDVIIDVNLGGKLIGSIGAREGDNAAHLASEFVRQHGLSPSHTKRLCDIVKTRVDEFYDEEAARVQDAKRQEWAAQRAPPKLTQPISPQFASSDHNSRQAFGHTHTGSQINSRKSRGSIVGRLKVELGGGKVGHCVVREGDNPKLVAQNFSKTYGLRSEHARELEIRIREKMSPAPRSSNQRVESDGFGSFVGGEPGTLRKLTRQGNGTTRSASRKQAPMENGGWSNWDDTTRRSDERSILHEVPVSFEGLTPSQQRLLRKTLGLPEHPARPQPVSTKVSSTEASLQRTHSPMWHHPKSSKHIASREANARSAAGVGHHKPLFNLDVDIGHGKQERIVVYAGDSPRQLAEEFVTAHGLSINKISKLEALLFENIRVHNSAQ